jgi:hypothetical protein
LKCNIWCDALIHIQNGTRDILNNSPDVCWFFICTAVYLCSSYSSIVNSTQHILQMFIQCVVVSFTEQIHFQGHICSIKMLDCDKMVGLLLNWRLWCMEIQLRVCLSFELIKTENNEFLGWIRYIYWNSKFLYNKISIKTKFPPPPCIAYHSLFWLSCLSPLVFLFPKILKIIWLSNLSTLNMHDEGYFRNSPCTINYVPTYLLEA